MATGKKADIILTIALQMLESKKALEKQIKDIAKSGGKNLTVPLRKSITKSFQEILRVLKSGSSATLAPVRIAQNYESEVVLSEIIQEEIKELESEGNQVTFTLIREEENPENKEKISYYRLVIQKN